MSLWTWLRSVFALAPSALAKSVPVLVAVAPYIATGVHSAEQIPGATGPQKLEAAVAIAQAGILAAQAVGAHVDAPVTNKAIEDGVNAVVAAVNSFHGKT